MAEDVAQETTVDEVRFYLTDGLRERLTAEQIQRVIDRLPRRAPMYLARAIEAGLARRAARPLNERERGTE